MRIIFFYPQRLCRGKLYKYDYKDEQDPAPRLHQPSKKLCEKMLQSVSFNNIRIQII